MRPDFSGEDGVLLGRWRGDYLRHDGPEHVLCFAPTRSGKGVGLVVPTLLTWPGSAIVHDIKGENWTLTAGWRARFGRVLLFDPTNAKALPTILFWKCGAASGKCATSRTSRMCWSIPKARWTSAITGRRPATRCWSAPSCMCCTPNRTRPWPVSPISSPIRSGRSRPRLRAMMTTPHLGEAGVHPVVASAARELLNKSENERSGVLSTAMSFLGLYRDPVVAAVTRRCDWRIRDLVEANVPRTLYLVVPPSDISRTKPLVRLILNQIGRRLTEELNSKDRRHRLLLMLDEFPALGRLDFFESALAFMAGYGLKSFLIAQSLNQIEKAYGVNNSILDNCHVRVSFATNDERTAKRVSDALGTATEIRDAKNYAGHRLSPWLGHLMVSRQETARPLLTPGEVMQLPPDDELVLVSGCHPIRARKARYFEDPQLQARILPPPVPAAANVDTAVASRRQDDNPWAEAVVAAERPAEDPDNAGIRREPKLPEQEEVVLEPRKSVREFDLADDEPPDASQDLQALLRRTRRLARQVALDPGDGMDL